MDKTKCSAMCGGCAIQCVITMPFDNAKSNEGVDGVFSNLSCPASHFLTANFERILPSQAIVDIMMGNNGGDK